MSNVEKWSDLLKGVGIDDTAAETYASKLHDSGITDTNIEMVDRDMLQELGVTKLGHQLSIMKLAKRRTSTPVTNATTPSKLDATKAPQLKSDMTPQLFRKFLIDWKVFCDITNLPETQYHAQLYSNADDSVQTALITTFPDFFSIPVSAL